MSSLVLLDKNDSFTMINIFFHSKKFLMSKPRLVLFIYISNLLLKIIKALLVLIKDT
jgi:hypothetical protein